MARETKAERLAKEEAKRAEYHARFVADYPDRLLNLVYEYATLGSDFTVHREGADGFRFSTSYTSYTLPTKIDSFTMTVYNSLDSVEYEVESYKRARLEKERLAEVKREALKKVSALLNDEERKLLGLK